MYNRLALILALMMLCLQPILAQDIETTAAISVTTPFFTGRYTGTGTELASISFEVPENQSILLILAVLEDDRAAELNRKGFDITIADDPYSIGTAITPVCRIARMDESGLIWLKYNGGSTDTALLGISAFYFPPDYNLYSGDHILGQSNQQLLVSVESSVSAVSIGEEEMELDGYLAMAVIQDSETNLDAGIELQIEDSAGPLNVDIDLGSWRTFDCSLEKIVFPAQLSATHRDNSGSAVLALSYFDLESNQVNE